MNLVKLLENRGKEFEEGEHGVFNGIRFGDGNIWLSIQASSHHFCTPRENLSLDEYTHFEVMAEVPRGDIPEHWYGEYDDIDVFSYVLKEDIEQVIRYLTNKYGMID